MIDDATLQAALSSCLDDAEIAELPNHYKGKVRDNYILDDGRRLLITTDRQSAFDKMFPPIPFKGQVLTKLALFWFEQTKDICPNYVLETPDPNVIIGKNLKMAPVEIVVRDYLTGSTDTSIWMNYQKGERSFGGITLHDGMAKNTKLPQTIITPTTKADQGAHDLPITSEEVVKQGLVSADDWQKLQDYSFALFARGREIAAKNGLILVDTKYEFGFDENGQIMLADEIHTPDSSRYWLADSYDKQLAAGAAPESLDKEFLRLWVTERCDPYKDPIPPLPDDVRITFAKKYIAAYELITGQPFHPVLDNNQPAIQRICKNLSKNNTINQSL